MSGTVLVARAAVGRARSGARRLTARARKGHVILAYHRVGSAGPDPQLLNVTREHFAEQMAVLTRVARPVRLRQLVGDIGALDRAVAVTFDDGYKDNLHVAKPVLTRNDVPATVFAATGHVGSSQSFWWDELADLLLSPGVLPERLSLRVGDQHRIWELDGAARYDEAVAQANSRWNVLDQSDPTTRHAVYRELCRKLRKLPASKQEAVLVQLRALTGRSTGGDGHMVLSGDEIRELVCDGLAEIGAHTVTHPVLARLSGSAQVDEIESSRRQLEEIVDAPVRSFAYPYGTWHDYDGRAIRAVRSGGFAYACANVPGCVRRYSDRFQLPRLLVRDWDGLEFERRLREWLG